MSWSYLFSIRLPQQGSHGSRRRCWRKRDPLALQPMTRCGELTPSWCSHVRRATRRSHRSCCTGTSFRLHSWQEAWPAKLSAEKTAELRRRFEEDYRTELLDSEVFPSSRLLALTSKMVAEKEIRWLPWRFRLSAKAQDDNLMIRPKKLPRLQELSDLLLDEAPTRDIHDGPASYNMINQLLTLATNSIALCQGAHLRALKMYQKRFLRLCFTKYESARTFGAPLHLRRSRQINGLGKSSRSWLTNMPGSWMMHFMK